MDWESLQYQRRKWKISWNKLNILKNQFYWTKMLAKKPFKLKQIEKVNFLLRSYLHCVVLLRNMQTDKGVIQYGNRATKAG